MEIITNEQLRKMIGEHLAKGGSIYDPKRQLPYYEKMMSVVKRHRRNGEPDYKMEDLYAELGFIMDRPYNLYLELLDGLKGFADKEGYVDDLNKVRGVMCVKNKLRDECARLGCSPGDYLLLMTPYKFKRTFIQDDYISVLFTQLKEAYPDGDTTNIKRENPRLYEQIRHVLRYSPESVSMQDLALFFGIQNYKFKDETPEFKLDERKIVEEYIKAYSLNPEFSAIRDNSELYYKALKCATSKNQTYKQWLKSHALPQQNAIEIPRFSKIMVDTDKRAKQIQDAKSKIMKRDNLVRPTDPVKAYHFDLDLAKKVIEEIAVKSQNEIKLD